MEADIKIVEKLEDFALLTSYLEQIRFVGMANKEDVGRIVISSFNDAHLQDLLTDIIGVIMREPVYRKVMDALGREYTV